jgi:signal transduction histidine kinase
VNTKSRVRTTKLLASGLRWLVCLYAGLMFYLAAVGSGHQLFTLESAYWLVVLALVELLPVPAWRGLQLSLSIPILVAIAILHDPLVAGAIVFVGSFDSAEIRRSRPALTALFNRGQIAVAVQIGSMVFHEVTSQSVTSFSGKWYELVGGGLVLSATIYAVNVAFVLCYMRLAYGISLGTMIVRLRVGKVPEFLLSYVGLGFLGLVIVRLFQEVGSWSVFTFMLPLIFARQMFFRSMALEEAGKELKDREQVLRELSNRMAEERQDERMQIAGYLHDDLAQMLFRLNLQIEMAKKRLGRGDLSGVGRDLEGLSGTKDQTSDMIRALIRDLHRSPIGRAGLAEAISSFAQDMSRGSSTRITAEVVEVSLPPPIQLLIYQISREATTNALKHAEAANIWISLRDTGNGVELRIRDDGNGFDTSAPPPEGHYGAVMMRERALVARGTFAITSEPGTGTTITVTFPQVWVEEGSKLEEGPEGAGESMPTLPRTAPVGSTTGPPPHGRTKLAKLLHFRPEPAGEDSPSTARSRAISSRRDAQEQPPIRATHPSRIPDRNMNAGEAKPSYSGPDQSEVPPEKMPPRASG